MQRKSTWTAGAFSSATWIVCVGALVGCDSDGNKIGGSQQALTAECVAADAELPEGAWQCPEPLTVECDATADLTLYVRDGSEASCDGQTLSVSEDGPLTPGLHVITVNDENGAGLCTAELTVTDSVAPAVEGKTLNLWPPNHKFHTISVSDCVGVVDACQPELTGEFIWASSDEPVNDLGDGNHEPDILFGDCQTVQVRAERQGPKDGRVYKLGVRVVDGAGNASEGQCTIIVDHDQRGVQGADSGEAYRITLDGSDGQLECDGVTEVPPPPPPPPADGDPVEPADGDPVGEPADGDPVGEPDAGGVPPDLF